MHRRVVLRSALALALGAATTPTAVAARVTQHDPDTAALLDGLVSHLRRADVWGGLDGLSGALVALCRQELDAAPPTQRPAVGRVLAEAAMEHWWQLWQAGAPDGPAFSDAMALAGEWDQPALVAHLLSFRAGTALRDDHDPHESLRLARLAQDARWRPSPGERARALGREAHAAAALGDRDTVNRALDARQDALDAMGPDTEPQWLDWMLGQVDLEHAACDLVRHGANAIPTMERALSVVEPHRTRTIAVFRGFIASAYVDASDEDGAVREIETVARLSEAGRASWSLGEVAARAQRLPRVAEALADYGLTA